MLAVLFRDKVDRAAEFAIYHPAIVLDPSYANEVRSRGFRNPLFSPSCGGDDRDTVCRGNIQTGLDISQCSACLARACVLGAPP